MERKTIQRQEIMDVLKNIYDHKTIKELCEALKDKSIGQATVYRTVNSLVLENKIRRIECPDGVHYDYRMDHYHFYCLSCHNIKDVFLDDSLIDKLLLNVHSNSNLDDIKYINLVFEGICDSCKGKGSYGVK